MIVRNVIHRSVPVVECRRDCIKMQSTTKSIAEPAMPNNPNNAEQYSPEPRSPIGSTLDLILPRQAYSDTSPYALSLQLLQIYGIRRYKGKFYLYTGSHYEFVDDETMRQLTVSTFIGLVEANGNSGFVESVMSELRCNLSIVVTESSICRTAAAFRNCLFDLTTLLPVPPNKNFVTFFSVEANFVPDVFYNETVRAFCTPTFDEFLMRISGGDTMLISRIWEMLGYIITPDNFGRAFFVLQGVPASGKSTIERLLVRMFSRGSVFKVNGEELGTKFVFQGLENKAVIIISDMPDKSISRAGASAIKKITGRDVISSDVKHGDRTQFETNAKILCLTNYQFSSDCYDQALYDRAVTVPFRYTVPKEAQDTMLDEKLAREIDNIATKALSYYITLVGNHYQFSGSYALNECIQSSVLPEVTLRTMIYNFVRDYFIADSEGVVSTIDAYDVFRKRFGSNIDITRFSENFRLAAEELFGAKKIKIRFNPSENPRNAMQGLQIKS